MVELSQLLFLNTGSDKMLPMTFMALVDEEDIPAFEELYYSYRNKMHGIALAVLNDAHDAKSYQ